jgi:hypothetical protein
MKYKVKLEKINSTHDNLRTSEVIGTTMYERPIQNDYFSMISEPLTKGKDIRHVMTSRVKKVRNVEDENGNKLPNTFEFVTEFSLYRITYLD